MHIRYTSTLDADGTKNGDSRRTHRLSPNYELVKVTELIEKPRPDMAVCQVDVEDYSVYSHLSDEELLQIAVERSLTDKQFPPLADQRASTSQSLSSSASHSLVTPTQSNRNSRWRNPDPSRSPSCVPPSQLPLSETEEVSNTANPPTALSQFLYRAHKKELSLLQSLIVSGNAEALLDLVRQRSSSLTEPNDDGWIALHEAAFYGQLHFVRILIEAHPDTVNVCNLKNQTALMLAAERRNVSCIDFLLRHRADPNMANKDRDTPLFTACEHPNEAIVDLLLRFGAQVNRSCSLGGTALHEACRHGRVKLCKMLLEAGANIQTRNIYGIQPFFVSAQHGHVDIIHLMAKRGADINGQAGDGASPLYEACKNGHVSAVEALLSLKADTNRSTKSGLLPLHVAVQNNHIRIVSLLIPVTSRVRVQRSGISPLHIATEKNRDDILELLIESGFDVNAKLSEERSKMYEDRRSTALYFAVYNGNLDAAKMLLEAGADPNLDVFNPLLIAVRLGWMDMAALLLRYNADVNAQISMQPSSFPSAILLSMESLPMLKLLLDNGCDAQLCFDCLYGQKPHPDVTLSRHPIEAMQISGDAAPQRPVQFCEAVSSISFCQLTGPIISMLLDYTSHVRLCSQLLGTLEGHSDWAQIKLKAFPPHPLMHLCRLKIRSLVGAKRLKLLHTLPLPVRLIRFLQYDRKLCTGKNDTSKQAPSWLHLASLGLDQQALVNVNRTGRNTNQLKPKHSHNLPGKAPPPTQTTAHYSSPNPPAEKPPDPKTFDGTISRFMTGFGKRMVAYRRPDGNVVFIAPEPEEEEEPLFKAISAGDVSRVKALMMQPGTNLMLPSKPGWLAIHQAAWFGQDTCLKVLLSAQPGMINKRTDCGETALLIAVNKDQLRCIEVLLEHGADPDITNYDKETPLYKACERNNAATVAMLLNHGVGVNTHCIHGCTALQEAVVHDNVEICEMLLKAGAKQNLTNMFGISPLFTAAQSGHLATLRFLLRHGADINSQAADGATALYEAAKNGHEDTVKLLLSQNADANKPGKTGLLPLHIAAQRGSDTIVSMLISATSKARIRRTGISPLHLAAERNRDEVLEILIKAGFDAGANPNLDMFKPLMVAARLGCIQTIILLVEHGADINASIPTHPTTFPAVYMFSMKYLSMFKYLLDHGGHALSCFDCIYGSRPHPPIKTIRSQRDELRYSDHPVLPETQSRRGVQFCEMISAPSISRWAGPIIDVLLDYVGHVNLCSRLMEHLDSYSDWSVIKEKAAPPRPLLQLCRLHILKMVGIHRVKKLPLPGGLIRFLQHQEAPLDEC
ncbi:hypothetical protein Q5P01_004506 [Channa striata]|uniref:SOCS box domain-containing protein n=1 Tax=Channa striata TaxID=64152 RepID=A0AA88NEF1_CHASR|nr:hypothetical protein Q5P01_004506 [Channa striata]